MLSQEIRQVLLNEMQEKISDANIYKQCEEFFRERTNFIFSETEEEVTEYLSSLEKKGWIVSIALGGLAALGVAALTVVTLTTAAPVAAPAAIGAVVAKAAVGAAGAMEAAAAAGAAGAVGAAGVAGAASVGGVAAGTGAFVGAKTASNAVLSLFKKKTGYGQNVSCISKSQIPLGGRLEEGTLKVNLCFGQVKIPLKSIIIDLV